MVPGDRLSKIELNKPDSYLSKDNFLCFKVFDDIFVYVYNLFTHLVSLTLGTTEPSFSETCLVLRM